MTMVVAIWCRHIDDNIIGIDNALPWRIESDTQHFVDTVNGQNVVCGRKTYEGLPKQVMENCRVFVFSRKTEYDGLQNKTHQIISSQKKLEDNLAEDENVYIAGGAQIYELFMQGKEKFKPHIIVDCVYEGALANVKGHVVHITPVIEMMKKQYRKITPDYCQDQVASAIWIKKGEFVEQSVLKRLLSILEKDAVLR